MTQRTPKEIAEIWYRPSEVVKAIARSGSEKAGVWDLVPQDVYSLEFAVWMTDHLRRAMVKGFQLADSNVMNKKDESVKENENG